MRKMRLLAVSLLIIPLASIGLWAEEQTLSPQDKAQFERIQAAFMTAINRNDPSYLFPYLDEGFRGKMISGEWVRGNEGVRKFWEKVYQRVRKEGGTGAYDLKLNPKDIQVKGNVAMVKGRTDEAIELNERQFYKFHSEWDVTLRKRDGVWKLAFMDASLSSKDKASLALQAVAHKVLRPPLLKTSELLKGKPDYDQDRGRLHSAKKSGNLGLPETTARPANAKLTRPLEFKTKP